MVYVTCVRGEFCQYTLIRDHFNDFDWDKLFFSDRTNYTNYTVQGMNFSALNHTYYGYPHERYDDFSLVAAASDFFEGTCF